MCPVCNYQSTPWSVVIDLQRDEANINGVQRRVLDRIDEKLKKRQILGIHKIGYNL